MGGLASKMPNTALTFAVAVLAISGAGIPWTHFGIGGFYSKDEILAVARRHGVVVIEDNAHGLFGRYRGAYLGTLGALATQSFHETKNFNCSK